MEHEIRAMLNAIATNKPIQAEEAFHRAASAVAVAQLDQFKQSVAQKIYGGKK